MSVTKVCQAPPDVVLIRPLAVLVIVVAAYIPAFAQVATLGTRSTIGTRRPNTPLTHVRTADDFLRAAMLPASM